MSRSRSIATISYNMSRIRSRGTTIEKLVASALRFEGLKGYRRNVSSIIGKPDFSWGKQKIALFCDSSFWHGYRRMATQRHRFKSNKKFWIKKILGNMERDREVNRLLRKQGWKVLRFWDFQIEKDARKCINKIKKLLRRQPR